MSASAPAFPTASSDPVLGAAAGYGAGVVRLLRGMTRRVFGLGRVTKRVAAGLRSEGEDTTSPNCRVDISGVIALLRNALHLADALLARLRIPAMAATTRRPPSAPGPAREAGQPRREAREPTEEDYADPLFLLVWRRTSKDSRTAFRGAIEEMSDAEVIERIRMDLMLAAEILGDGEEAARVMMMAYRAALVISPEAREPLRQRAAPVGVAAGEPPDGGAGPSDGAGARTGPHAMGRGPPR